MLSFAEPHLFKYSIEYITKYFWYKKVPELAILVKSVKSMDEGCLQCEVKDPTGQIEATINRDLIDKFLNQQPIQGVVLHVKWVCSVFTSFQSIYHSFNIFQFLSYLLLLFSFSKVISICSRTINTKSLFDNYCT
jgi:hypothetical protein